MNTWQPLIEEMNNPLATRWQPLIGNNVIRGWQVTAIYAWQAKDLIEATMVKEHVYSLRHNWCAGGRKVTPVQEVSSEFAK